MIEFELDIPSLSEEGIEMEYYRDKPFEGVRELHSSSMIDWLIMIEMLIVLINSFNRRVGFYQRKIGLYKNGIVEVEIRI